MGYCICLMTDRSHWACFPNQMFVVSLIYLMASRFKRNVCVLPRIFLILHRALSSLRVTRVCIPLLCSEAGGSLRHLMYSGRRLASLRVVFSATPRPVYVLNLNRLK